MAQGKQTNRVVRMLMMNQVSFEELVRLALVPKLNSFLLLKVEAQDSEGTYPEET
jgi:hypothetical protein